MCIIKLAKKFIKKMEWYDIPLVKSATLLWVLFLLTVWAGLANAVLSVEWYWYLILAVIVSIPLFKKIFSK